MKKGREKETEEIEAEERPIAQKYGVIAYSEKISLPPEIEELIELRIDERLKELLVPETRVTKAQKKTETLYDVWTGLLSFITCLSAYVTAASVIPIVPGILLTIACIATLILFIVFR